VMQRGLQKLWSSAKLATKAVLTHRQG